MFKKAKLLLLPQPSFSWGEGGFRPRFSTRIIPPTDEIAVDRIIITTDNYYYGDVVAHRISRGYRGSQERTYDYICCDGHLDDAVR